MAVYAMFGVLMLTSKIVMEAVPNVHLLGMFTMLLTVVYRRRALYPIYVYVLLNGVYAGFALPPGGCRICTSGRCSGA